MKKFNQRQGQIFAFLLLVGVVGCSSSAVQSPSQLAVAAKSADSNFAMEMKPSGGTEAEQARSEFDKYRLEFKLFAADSGLPSGSEKPADRCQGRLKEGQPIGRWTCSSENGRRISSAAFSEGRLNGWVRTWFSNGKKQSEALWQKGGLNGPATKFYANGAREVSVVFKNDELQGLMILRDEKGRKKWSSNFENGKQTGRAREFYENGIMKSRAYYFNGKKSGFYTEWYPTGNIKLNGEYRDDRPVGSWQFWPNTEKAKPRSGPYEEIISGSDDVE
jgi:antitoxin component YwqK of YwqJK toxin-antitoxin module